MLLTLPALLRFFSANVLRTILEIAEGYKARPAKSGRKITGPKLDSFCVSFIQDQLDETQ
jgi:DNA-binding ferritin-like protein (Dps family)